VPVFVLSKSESGVHIESTRPVFRRGVRLDRPTARRLRDQVYIMLSSLGLESGEIASLSPLCPRQIRNIVNRASELTTDEALRGLATACALKGDHRRWRRHVRDAVCLFLVSLGMDVEDAAQVLKFHACEANVRQRIGGVPPEIASAVSGGAWRALQAIKPDLDRERARRAEARKGSVEDRL
jgi:hypothetical protein